MERYHIVNCLLVDDHNNVVDKKDFLSRNFKCFCEHKSVMIKIISQFDLQMVVYSYAT